MAINKEEKQKCLNCNYYLENGWCERHSIHQRSDGLCYQWQPISAMPEESEDDLPWHKCECAKCEQRRNQIARRLFPDMLHALLEYRNPKKLSHYRELESLIDDKFWEWYEDSWLDKEE